MSKMGLATARLSDAATLSTTGTVSATLPLANLQTMQPGRVCRFTSLTGMRIIVDFGAAVALNWFELINHNGTAAATWLLRGATSQANLSASPGHSSGTISMWPASGKPTDPGLKNLASLLYVAAAPSFRWWDITVTDAANPAGYWQAGRLIMDNAFVPKTNFAYGIGYGFVDLSQRHRAPGGQTQTINGGRLKRISFALPALDAADAFGRAWPLDLDRGTAKDVSFYANMDETTHRHRKSIYGLISDMSSIEHLKHPHHSKGYVIEELLP